MRMSADDWAAVADPNRKDCYAVEGRPFSDDSQRPRESIGRAE
jgi:hypothetical protein